jgi:ElaB/YqjD/DUF883 family membrane-anchored ribosome-binding protein
MANANTPFGNDDNSLSSAAEAAKEGAAEAVIAAKDGMDAVKDAAAKHPIRDQVAATVSTIKDEASKRAATLKSEAAGLKDQASAKAVEAANAGKGKAAEAVGSIAKLLEDTASTVDEKFGKQYGDYARTAATSVSGFAQNLDQKELDELANSARDFVKKSPAVAVGAAAVVGFVIARLLKGSSDKE